MEKVLCKARKQPFGKEILFEDCNPNPNHPACKECSTKKVKEDYEAKERPPKGFIIYSDLDKWARKLAGLDYACLEEKAKRGDLKAFADLTAVNCKFEIRESFEKQEWVQKFNDKYLNKKTQFQEMIYKALIKRINVELKGKKHGKEKADLKNWLSENYGRLVVGDKLSNEEILKKCKENKLCTKSLSSKTFQKYLERNHFHRTFPPSFLHLKIQNDVNN